MLTIPKETTDPGREREINLRSPSVEGFGVGVDNITLSGSGISAGNICREPRRGGGDKEVIPADWSVMCCKTRGGGKGGIVGVSKCKKLGSSWKDIIFSAMGIAGFVSREAKTGFGA